MLVNPNQTQIIYYSKLFGKKTSQSEVSGDYLGKKHLSTYFHHILPKNKYPEIRIDEENIILLTVDEHANVEADIYKYDELIKDGIIY